MSQVQFYMGTLDSIKNQPLKTGSIFFSTTDHNLYIDTPTARLPVAGTGLANKHIYIKLTKQEGTQTITTYFDDLGATGTQFQLKDILTAESMLFIGYTGYNITLTARAQDNSSLTFTIVDSSQIQEDYVIIDIFIPNPKQGDIGELEVYKSIYCDEFTLFAKKWKFNDDTKEYEYELGLGGITDFDINNYIIYYADDAIENYKMAIEAITNENTQTTDKLKFRLKSEKQPLFNCSFGILKFLNENKIYTIKTTTYDEGEFNDITGQFKDNGWLDIDLRDIFTISDGVHINPEESIVCVIPTEECKKLFNNTVKKIEINDNYVAKIYLKDEIRTYPTRYQKLELLFIVAHGFNSKIYNYTISRNNWSKTEKLDSLTQKNIECYYQVIEQELSMDNTPIVVNTNIQNQKYFNKIDEVKCLSSNKLVIYSKEEIPRDFEIKIIDYTYVSLDD